MKILYYFRDIDSLMFQWQKYHIVDEMSRHQCIIDILSPTDFTSYEQANEAIIHRVKNDKYDVFMTCLGDKYLFAETVNEIKRIGIPTLLFCPDNLVAPYNHRRISNLFDLVWLTSRDTEYLFRRWGCRTVFQPYAANPFFLTPIPSVTHYNRVGFIGNPHGSRIDRINYLLKNHIPVTVHTKSSNLDGTFLKAGISDYIDLFYNYSKYPIGRKLAIAAIIDKFTKRHLSDPFGCLEKKEAVQLDHLSEVNGQYALVLSFTDANSSGVLNEPVKIVNLRNFEIPMSGGLQFTLYSEELACYFENDKEIVMGKTMEECVEKAKFYLRDEKEPLRESMRFAARKRAENDHTWFRRFEVVLGELGFNLD